MRRREALGLQWSKVNWDKKEFAVNQSLATPKSFKETGIITETTKTNDSVRTLLITPETHNFFLKQFQRYLLKSANDDYKDYDLIICRKNGLPFNPASYSGMYPLMIERVSMPKLTIQGLRRSAASNLHSLDHADPYTISRILGHTIKGISNENSHVPVSEVTYRYIDVSMEKKE